MARFVPQDDMDTFQIPGAGNFQFSAVRLDPLKAASEYTLVTKVLDLSGSVENYKDPLLQVVKTVVAACKKSPRVDNLMLRLLGFNDSLQEIHGFRLFKTIDPDNDYKPLHPMGMTALYDAVYSAIGATLTLSQSLIAQEYDCNGAIYITTDGLDNRSIQTPKAIRQLIEESKKLEKIQGLTTVLIGVTPDKQISRELEKFQQEAGLTAYIDMGEATPGKLAKLAQFVSKSISSQSQALNQGTAAQTASQPLTF